MLKLHSTNIYLSTGWALLAVCLGVSLAMYLMESWVMPSDQQTSSIQTMPSEERDMIQLTNQYREAHKLAPLTVNAKLMASAQDKASTICRTVDFSHTAGGEKFFAAIDLEKYHFTHAGENLARGYDTAAEAFKALVASPTHLANITGEYKDIGVAFSYCDGKKYYVIHYGEQ